MERLCISTRPGLVAVAVRRLKVDCGHVSARANHDCEFEIGIRLESKLHAGLARRRFFASSTRCCKAVSGIAEDPRYFHLASRTRRCVSTSTRLAW